MAIDTRDKRASLICLSLPFGRVWPNADGGIDTNPDHAHMSYLYSMAIDELVIIPDLGDNNLLIMGVGE